MNVNEYLFYKASLKKIPLSGSFELSPVCNFSCKMCYVRKTREQLKKEGKKEYTADDWIALAKQCKESGTLYVLLTGGEPFLYPRFRYLYETLHEMGFVLSINSNGTMIDKETVQWLKQHAPSRVNITLYGASRETYERICGVPDGYDKTVEAILMLKEAKIPVVINASMIPENAADMKAILDFGKEHHILVRMGTYMFPPVRRVAEDTDSRFQPEEAGRLSVMRQMYSLEKETFLKQAQYMVDSLQKKQVEDDSTWGQDTNEQMRCRAGRSTFWVDWEGKMTACGIVDFPVAKYPFKEPFQDCWSEITEEVRKKTVLKGCAGCEKREICHPCAAIILAETGDVNKKAPYMCEMAEASVKCWKQVLVDERVL